jgi:hypothetical protein
VSGHKAFDDAGTRQYLLHFFRVGQLQAQPRAFDGRRSFEHLSRAPFDLSREMCRHVAGAKIHNTYWSSSRLVDQLIGRCVNV